MSVSAIVTVIGRDRPGLTQSIAAMVVEAGGNWLESHLSSMGGMFVGSLLVEVDRGDLSPLEAALATIDPAGLRITIVPVARAAATDADYPHHLSLELVGQDRPGIVQEVTTALAGLKINISEFESSVENSSWSGARLFHASAELALPAHVTEDEVRDALECLSGEIMVDLDATEEDPVVPRPEPIP